MTELTLTQHAIQPVDEAGAYVNALNAKYKGVVFDCNDKAGMESARLARVEIRDSRYAIEKARAARVTELSQASKSVSARAAELTVPLVEVEDPIHGMIITVEERLLAEKTERERIASERAQAMQAIVRGIEVLPGRLMGASVSELQGGLDELTVAASKLDSMDEPFKTAATLAIEEVGDRLSAAIAERADLDKQAAVLLEQQRLLEEQRRVGEAALAAQRAELEASMQAQREEMDRVLAAQRAELAVQAEAQREVRERQQREDAESEALRQAALHKLAQEAQLKARELADRMAEERAAREAEAVASATVATAAREAVELLQEVGQGENIVTRKLIAALAREMLAF